MRHEPCGFQYASPEASVAEAADLAQWLIGWMLPRAGGCREVARAQLSQMYGVSVTLLCALTQPSRRPKQVPAHELCRLRAAKLMVGEALMRRLATDVAVVRAKAERPDFEAIEQHLAAAARLLDAIKRSNGK